MGYRHTPLYRRLGLFFSDPSYWKVDMSGAECFMYFIKGLPLIFGEDAVLYVEGNGIDPDVADCYREFHAETSQNVMRFSRTAATQAHHLRLSSTFQKALARMAERKTYKELCDLMMVYQGNVMLMDGSRLGDRSVLFSGSIPEEKIKRFSSTRVHGIYEWVEGGPKLV